MPNETGLAARLIPVSALDGNAQLQCRGVVMPERSRALRFLLLLDLLPITLIFGQAVAHVGERPGKVRLSSPVWLIGQQTLYSGFGAFASVAEPLPIVLASILSVLLRVVRSAGRHVLLAVLRSSAGLIEWSLVVSPMNICWEGERRQSCRPRD